MAEIQTLRELQHAYSIPGVVAFDHGHHGMIRLVVTTDHAEAHVYVHGAHLTHFRPRDQEPVLFLSGQSRFEAGKPIRGGVPVIFPWFGPHPTNPALPQHGLVRLTSWQVESVRQDEAGSVHVGFRFAANEATREAWPHDFALRYRVSVGGTLGMELEVRNPTDQPLEYTEALHTYLSVSDVRQVELQGLGGVEYLDKTQEMARRKQGEAPVRFEGETDRIYLNTRGPCTVRDPGRKRQIRIEKDGSDSTIVWNPWTEKARQMPDFGDGEWPGMLCVESGNVAENLVILQPGQTQTLRTSVRVER